MEEKLKINIRKAKSDDLPILEAIRAEAFAPVFESFRQILGDAIYETAQKREDEDQGRILASMFSSETEWFLYVVESNGEAVGFVSFRLDEANQLGEIGLNAVRPAESGKGIGTRMYEFALSKMKDVGLKVAMVATGGDESHAPARKAYEKSGFNVSIPSVWMCREL
ncbi:MAG: GNAT family N-acetyltransferase [Opitutales bacterium]|nr:GNAT family N-acetyltransferase [Opitutales bacterium]